MAAQAGTQRRMSRSATPFRRDEAAILIGREIVGVDRIGERARFHVDEGDALLAMVKRRNFDRNAKVAGLANRFHRVEPRETWLVEVIEFAADVMSDAGLIEHHRCEPRPRNEHRIGLSRAVLAAELRNRNTVMQRKAALAGAEHEDFHPKLPR